MRADELQLSKIGLKKREERLREKGFLSLDEVATRLELDERTVRRRRARGPLGLRAVRLDNIGRYMYEDPVRAADASHPTIPGTGEEVQYGA